MQKGSHHKCILGFNNTPPVRLRPTSPGAPASFFYLVLDGQGVSAETRQWKWFRSELPRFNQGTPKSELDPVV
jgi:hypothetical protein